MSAGISRCFDGTGCLTPAAQRSAEVWIFHSELSPRHSMLTFRRQRLIDPACSGLALEASQTAATQLDKVPRHTRKNPRTLLEKADAGLIGGLRFLPKHISEFSE